MVRIQVNLTVCAVIFLHLTAVALAAEVESEDKLLGLWGAEKAFLPAAEVLVLVEPEGDRLLARVAGLSAIVTTDGDEFRFELPFGQGSFRGTHNRSNDEVVGHWISEPGDLVYSALAAPLTLHALGEQRWQGVVRPFEQRFSVYILIERDEDGVLRALLRNPERNQGVFTRVHNVVREGVEVRFLDADANLALEASYNEEHGVLTVAMPWRGGSYDLTRRDRSSAPGFYPRRDTDAYRYQMPSVLPDGWLVATPDSVGMDEARLTEFVQSVLDTQTTTLRTPYIHSVLVARHGKLVLDEYFYGHHSGRTHDLRSASKSVTGLMVGRMLSESHSIGVESPVYPMFKGMKIPVDERTSGLHVSHLLSMRSGFSCDDNDYETPGNEDRMQEQSEQPDWYRYTLTLPLVAAPGESAVYCSAAINLLGGVVSEATGMWLPEFFRTRFAVPMQIEHYYYNLDPMGRGYAGGGIQMRPRDFLKFAQIMLDEGRWQGQRIIPGDWVGQSFAPHASIYSENDYGYTWWRGQLPYRKGTVDIYSATGNGGQLLVIVPDLDLVVAFNGGNYGDFRTWVAWRDALLPEYILWAIED